MAKILIIRLSAIGDVAMTVPVIYSAAKSNPEHTFTILTQTFLIPVFINRPANVEVLGINTKGAEKSIGGLTRFAWALSKFDYDIILDLHNVLRSMIIRNLCLLRGKKVFVIDKARLERKQLTRRHHKDLKPIRSVIDRYADVFVKAGLRYESSYHTLFPDETIDTEEFVKGKEERWVGIAPFAKHTGKIYPLEKMEKVLEYLARQDKITVFLFGSKSEFEIVLQKWLSQYPNVKSIVGRFSLDKELKIISKLDLLLSMDSANMHFASLVGTRVLSIWGATHPYAGFYGYQQKMSDAIQLDLSCRPCSIYGNKPCYRGDHACMNELSPEIIIDKIDKVFNYEGHH